MGSGAYGCSEVVETGIRQQVQIVAPFGMAGSDPPSVVEDHQHLVEALRGQQTCEGRLKRCKELLGMLLNSRKKMEEISAVFDIRYLLADLA